MRARPLVDCLHTWPHLSPRYCCLSSHRVLYDVALPWLAGGRNLAVALHDSCPEGDPWAPYQPAQISGTSGYRSVHEAVYYTCRRLGLCTAQLSQLSHVMLVESCVKVAEDAECLLRDAPIPPMLEQGGSSAGGGNAASIGGGPAGDASWVLRAVGSVELFNRDQQTFPVATLAGKVVALYFSGSWYEPVFCVQFLHDWAILFIHE